MRARLAYHRSLFYSILPSLAALGCDGPNEPVPTVTLSLHGQILSAGPTPLGIAGATVVLRQGFDEDTTLAETTTDQAGNYQLTYSFTSVCEPTANTTDWIEASADGYETASSLGSALEMYDPVIYCTNEPQMINLSLRPLGSLQVITNTSGSGLDADGYVLRVKGGEGKFPMVGYSMGLNDELIVSQVVGQYSLELTEVAPNCTVAGDNLRTVTVAARETTVSTFEVTCAPSEELPECSGPVALTVTASLMAPIFSWTPRCRLGFVLVEPTESGSDLWFIFSPGQNALAPPVTYGEMPAGAEELQGPGVLQEGATYKVIVFRWIGPGDDDGENIGVQTFTP